MAKDTVTLALSGEVHLDDFSVAIACFHRMIKGLTDQLAQDAVEWTVESLEVGSAIATVKGISADDADVSKVVDGYESLAQALHRRDVVLQCSPPVSKAARELVGIINGRVSSIRFETDSFDVDVSSADGIVDVGSAEANYGAVRGRIQSISNRGRLRFTLYDDIDDHAISCYLVDESEQEKLREAWGRFAIVEGIVRRNPVTGRPSTVRQVTAVTILDEGTSFDYRDAIGCAPALDDRVSPEAAIRRGRDG